MRAHGSDAPVPVLSAEPEGASPGPGRAALDDPSAVPGETYRYFVVAHAEREQSKMTGAGGPSSTSRPSAPIRVPDAPAGSPAIAAIGAPTLLGVSSPEASDGRALQIKFRIAADDDGLVVREYRLLRAEGDGPFRAFRHKDIKAGPADGERERSETIAVPPGVAWRFQLFAVPARGEPVAAATTSAAAAAEPSYFNFSHLWLFFLLALTVALTVVFLYIASQPGARLFIRRIPGVDAIEEAVGRSTEMGRPILYVPGIDEIQNIQTIASLLILGRVSEIVARYDTEIRVPCCIPLVAAVGEEMVKQGFYNAGRPDSHKPQNIQWISSEQFAFCAGTNGIMLREKPATNIFLGRFFAESLILAETGYVNRAIQIAGTGEITQLPFFIAACDYTLIGEELFAVSAYMTHEPRLIGTLKAADYVKLVVGVVLLVMTLLLLPATWSRPAVVPQDRAHAAASDPHCVVLGWARRELACEPTKAAAAERMTAYQRDNPPSGFEQFVMKLVGYLQTG
ncbi:MAG: hypothetical protein IT379_33950 [Deltaproteobacteria bacterium]|nr:hypothetical protein [Deltaproteobacteria bacterium]